MLGVRSADSHPDLIQWRVREIREVQADIVVAPLAEVVGEQLHARAEILAERCRCVESGFKKLEGSAGGANEVIVAPGLQIALADKAPKPQLLVVPLKGQTGVCRLVIGARFCAGGGLCGDSFFGSRCN